MGIVAGLGCKGRSRCGLGLPSAIATLDRIALDTPAAFFDRGFELAAVDAEGRRCTLARGRLVPRGGDGRPVEITFPPARVASLELMVDDGSDAPLTFRAEGRFAAPALFFAAPAGRYTLLLGNPEDQGPTYELAVARDLVPAVRSEPATAGALAQNPAFRRASRRAGGAGLQTAALWAVLGACVAVLAWLTLRLARRVEGPPEAQ
ncbi:MAG: hypothetical protein HY900_37530 [Deltaproteobacteria bacterium]|nr:hypothetical protein [Deltaproteobacteria bacterium]